MSSVLSVLQSIAIPPKASSKAPLAWVKQISAKRNKIASPLKTEPEAAAFLGVSLSTLRRLRKMGAIECCKLKGSYRYTLEQLQTYIKSVSVKTCGKSDFKSVSIGFPNAKEAPTTMPHGSTNTLVKHAGLHLAQKTFMKPK